MVTLNEVQLDFRITSHTPLEYYPSLVPSSDDSEQSTSTSDNQSGLPIMKRLWVLGKRGKCNHNPWAPVYLQTHDSTGRIKKFTPKNPPRDGPTGVQEVSGSLTFNGDKYILSSMVVPNSTLAPWNMRMKFVENWMHLWTL